MKRYNYVLTIAGSDSGGGAGVQADIKTISAIGAFAVSAITALTAQNTRGVKSILPVPGYFIKDQLAMIWQDFCPNAVKIGMLNSAETASAVCDFLEENAGQCKIVTDPVMIATSGSKLINDDAIEILKNRLFSLSTVITPNIPELEFLTGCKVETAEDMKNAGMKCTEMFDSKYVLVKGGHFKGNNSADILFCKGGQPVMFEGEFVETVNLHGTGCTLSSAIATYLSFGNDIYVAVDKAKRYVAGAIKASCDVSVADGNGPLNHFYNPQKMSLLID